MSEEDGGGNRGQFLTLADSSVLEDEELVLEDVRDEERRRWKAAAKEREKVRQYKAASGGHGVHSFFAFDDDDSLPEANPLAGLGRGIAREDRKLWPGPGLALGLGETGLTVPGTGAFRKRKGRKGDAAGAEENTRAEDSKGAGELAGRTDRGENAERVKAAVVSTRPVQPGRVNWLALLSKGDAAPEKVATDEAPEQPVTDGRGARKGDEESELGEIDVGHDVGSDDFAADGFATADDKILQSPTKGRDEASVLLELLEGIVCPEPKTWSHTHETGKIGDVEEGKKLKDPVATTFRDFEIEVDNDLHFTDFNRRLPHIRNALPRRTHQTEPFSNVVNTKDEDLKKVNGNATEGNENSGSEVIMQEGGRTVGRGLNAYGDAVRATGSIGVSISRSAKAASGSVASGAPGDGTHTRPTGVSSTENLVHSLLDEKPLAGLAAALAQARAKSYVEISEVPDKAPLSTAFPAQGLLQSNRTKVAPSRDGRGRAQQSQGASQSEGGSGGDALGEDTEDRDVVLEYLDEFGEKQTPKEAFRALSYTFHGIKPQKTKKQKQKNLRLKKKKEMAGGKSRELPTLRALQAAQKKGEAALILTRKDEG